MILKKTQLDNYLLFQFRFINKSKKVSDDFINHLREVSIQNIGQMLQGSKQQTGFCIIEVAKQNIAVILDMDIIMRGHLSISEGLFIFSI